MKLIAQVRRLLLMRASKCYAPHTVLQDLCLLLQLRCSSLSSTFMSSFISGCESVLIGIIQLFVIEISTGAWKPKGTGTYSVALSTYNAREQFPLRYSFLTPRHVAC
jgi:hypothetical protein